MTKVLVTGANGQLGKSLKDVSGSFEGIDFLFLGKSELDITNKGQIKSWFLKYNPDFCINCAAYTQVDQAEKTPQPAREINVKGVENLAMVCLEQGTTLVHISTDYVFDGEKAEGYTPSDIPNPLNVYGRTKLDGERIIQENLNAYFIIRTSWLYSKKYGPNFYKTILEKAKKGESLSITDSQRGCPTDAANLAGHILDIIQSGTPDYGISHYTDGVPMTWFDFASLILKQAGYAAYGKLHKVDNYRTFALRPRNSVLKP